jgi:hypothetical protein
MGEIRTNSRVLTSSFPVRRRGMDPHRGDVLNLFEDDFVNVMNVLGDDSGTGRCHTSVWMRSDQRHSGYVRSKACAII